MEYRIIAKDGERRRAEIRTARGVINTPAFMPVGTHGTVKAMSSDELKEIGAEIILGNTYHLNIRPGLDIIRAAGGLHRFINWERPILTDSGGFQVFSLAQMRKLDADGVTFRSHIDGSLHRFTPESVMALQETLGADLIIIGTHGYTGLKHVLLGSTAERVVRHGPCPVLTVKAAA